VDASGPSTSDCVGRDYRLRHAVNSAYRLTKTGEEDVLSAVDRTAGVTRATALGVAVLLLAGCGSSGTKPDAKAPAAPAAGASSPDPTAVAKQQVLSAYQGMFQAEVKALNASSLEPGSTG
jgi:hypothetical protein